MAERELALIAVALPVPLFRTFTYAMPAGQEAPVAGMRVVVPFINRREIGICVGAAARERLRRQPRQVLEVPDSEPVLSGKMLALCRWMSEYYVVPPGLTLRGALPAMLSGPHQPRPPRKTRKLVQLVGTLPTLLEREKMFARAKQQRALFELLESLGGASSVEHLQEHLAFSPGVLKGLEKRGLIILGSEEVDRDPFASRSIPAAPRHTATARQQDAIEQLSTAAPGDVFLLHGVTGSGKTLVYIELLRRLVLQRGKNAIVLVPEIALTPQTVDRFRAVFGDSIAVLHSALSDGERYDAWLALRRGEKRIAVGARSAVFAPVPNLGAIVLDEEHETTYKQGETPRYHAREVAIMRGQLEGATVVLGSATPSLESWSNAAAGKYRLLSLPERVAGGLPQVHIVDLRRKPATSPDDSAHGALRYENVVREELHTEIAATLARGEQVILLLNRRGYASFLICGECGLVVECPNCSISLTHHRSPERLLCHYCAHQEPSRDTCTRCGGRTIQQRGVGTQQVERLIAERFASARIARMDVDTTTGKWAHSEILDRVGRHEIDILLGTQMIAKGLDFPNVTLVGVVDADVGINLPDFRSSERAFQLLSQVAGRAGRGAKGGRVFIQTRIPRHHSVECAVNHDYVRFVNEELGERIEPPYPPNVRIANIIFSGTDLKPTAELALNGAEWLQELIATRNLTSIVMIGPAPSAIERIKTRWRWHVVLKATQPGDLTRVGRYFLERFRVPPRLRVTFDRDPVSLL